jgi:hypothetical protein
MLSVTFPTRLSRQLYSKCRAAFPNEEYAVLLGTHSGQEYEIEELYFPPERLKRMSPDAVYVKDSWLNDAHRLAQGLGLEVLGEIHSHCYDVELEGAGGLDPSEADWDRANQMKAATKGRFRLMGIVRVLKKGEKLGCRCRFWPAVDLPVTLK